MISKSLSRRVSCALAGVVLVAAAGAVVRAGGLSSRYDAEMRRLRSEWRAAQQAQGLDPHRGRVALYGKYPTPEITLCKAVPVAPGATGSIAVSGRFTPQTAVLSEHDHVTLTSGAVSGGKYSATATVARDALPGFARLFAYAPVSGAYDECGAVFVSAMPAFSLTASNGWTVVVGPDAKAWQLNDGNASLAYKAEYFKPGQTAAFETTRGQLSVSAGQAPDGSLWFGLQPVDSGSAMAEYQALTQQMSDPNAFLKMSPRQQEAFQKKLEEVGARMAKELEAMVSNPAALQEKQAQFGCGALSLEVEGAQVTGRVDCGEKVGRLTLTGTRR